MFLVIKENKRLRGLLQFVSKSMEFAYILLSRDPLRISRNSPRRVEAKKNPVFLGFCISLRQ